MKKPIRILFCLVAPLYPGNILFLAKQRRAWFAVPLLRLNLRLFHRSGLNTVAGIRHKEDVPSSMQLPDDLVRALICLGCIQAGIILRGTLKHEGNAAENAPYASNTHEPDANLRALIEGRSVAIVGPSEGEDNADEIEGFDIVIRVGYAGARSLPSNTGSRCDISFYAPHKMRRMVAGGKTEVLKSLRLVALFKLWRYRKFGISIDDLGLDRSRIAEAQLPVFRLTTANTLVKVLYNCLISKPASIKVFNADLFLSTTYPSGYLANKRTVATTGAWIHEDKSMCKSFAISHDPAEQLEFYKYFYHRGNFTADRRLSEIIEMPAEHYMDQLDALYGVPVRSQLGLAGPETKTGVSET